MANAQNGQALPFPIASRTGTRQAFDTGVVTLSASAPSVINGIPIPAVGYLKEIVLEVIVNVTGGTSPAFTADAPFNVLQSIGLRTASGNDIITPITGYQLMLINKYGGYHAGSDPRNSRQYSAANATGAHFFLRVPLEIDPETGLGSIPALASNRSYMLNMTMAAASTVLSGGPTVTVQVKGTSFYWHEPPATTSGGAAQVTQPAALGTVSQWQFEAPIVSQGDRFTKLSNVGNIIRNHIFVCRNSSGVRVDAAAGGWPTNPVEFYLDNEMAYSLSMNLWEQLMVEWFGLNAAAKDGALGLDTGVYVLPYHALVGDTAGDPSNSRSQLLPTLNASLVQLRGSWGASAASLEVLTNSIVPAANTGYSAIFSK